MVGRGEAAVLPGALVVADGVEREMYKFEAPVIALVRRVVVPEMAWLECVECQRREKFESEGKGDINGRET